MPFKWNAWEKTYIPNAATRKFKWINWRKDWPKIGIWILYTNSLIFPIIASIYKSLKYGDNCFLSEPMLNLVSTYSMIYGVLKNREGLKGSKSPLGFVFGLLDDPKSKNLEH